MNRSRATLFGLVLASAAALLASWSHYAGAALATEPEGRHWPAYASATAIDLAIIMVTLGVAVLARAQAAAWKRWVAVAVVAAFASLSAAANVYDGLATVTGARPTWAAVQALDPLTLWWLVIHRGGLPVASLLLAVMVEFIAAAQAPATAKRAKSKATTTTGDPVPVVQTSAPDLAPPVLVQGVPAGDPVALALADASLTNAEVARRTGVDPSTVTRKLRAAGWVRAADGGLQAIEVPQAARNGATAHAGEVGG